MESSSDDRMELDSEQEKKELEDVKAEWLKSEDDFVELCENLTLAKFSALNSAVDDEAGEAVFRSETDELEFKTEVEEVELPHVKAELEDFDMKTEGDEEEGSEGSWEHELGMNGSGKLLADAADENCAAQNIEIVERKELYQDTDVKVKQEGAHMAVNAFDMNQPSPFVNAETNSEALAVLLSLQPLLAPMRKS
ncbi:hypothetical protein NDN08_006582 [Rhodosorus marinus]|uniref:Uncharacterized protein n=1 Tax=Rhodosorus marinus TaxID=101924 RepID=A0AAV8UI01_9RHOD|nr:hypothetical protein NDN08_006582 [Rhodosorus marinus]